MTKHYPHILSAVQIGDTILRNRLIHPNASPHFLQGPESYPAESFAAHYAAVARAGAGLVTVAEWDNYPAQRTPGMMPDFAHMQAFDMKDLSVHNYVSAMVEDIHFYGSKALIQTRVQLAPGYSLHGGTRQGLDGKTVTFLPATREIMQEAIDGLIEKMKLYHSLGYDGCAFRLDEFMSNGDHQRDDEYGGSVENRTRFIREALTALKQAMGPSFIIKGTLHGEQPLGYYGGIRVGEGYELSETVQFTPLIDGIVDILTLREKDAARAHPLSYNFTKGDHDTIRYAKAIRAAGLTKTKIALCGGFQDPDEIESLIASGVCDMVSMGRAFFAEPEYEKKLKEGRAGDITPCILCNMCHGNFRAPWISVCSVSPRLGNEHKLHRLVQPVGRKKKVAVIGGGPAGMRAAIIAAQRGHDVTLFEKTDYLGGQLLHAEYFSFKWAIRNYRNWLVAQLDKNGVRVELNTAPTPDDIRSAGFDAVLAATGVTFDLPSGIKGLRDESGTPLYPTCFDVFGRESDLGKNVVIVGGSETGMETAMYLAENGHSVTVLTRQRELGHDASHLHYVTMSHMSVGPDGVTRLIPAWETYDSITGILNATTTEVRDNVVYYTDGDGVSHSIQADSVVICGGTTPCAAEARAYADCVQEFYAIGDCNGAGKLWKCNHDAFSKANLL